MVRRGHGEHVEVGEIAEDVVPRFVAVVALGRMAGPFLERGSGFLGGLLRARGDGDEVELHRREVARKLVEPDARELPGDAEALEVGIRAEVDVAAEHPELVSRLTAAATTWHASLPPDNGPQLSGTKRTSGAAKSRTSARASAARRAWK